MSLGDWLKAAWIHRHSSSRQEIANLLAAVDRDLGQCQLLTNADWKLAIAHNAVIGIASAALAVSGYRMGRDRYQELLISSLEYTLGVSRGAIDILQKYRGKRNIANYEQAGRVSDEEAEDILAKAYDLQRKLIAWLWTQHPELMKE